MVTAGAPYDRAAVGVALPLTHWCEAAAVTPDQRVHGLGASAAAAPHHALAWLRARVRDVADQLDPSSARPARYWLTDRHEQDRALRLLSWARTYSFLLFEEGVRYVVTARAIGTAPSAPGKGLLPAARAGEPPKAGEPCPVSPNFDCLGRVCPLSACD
ncbi:hypothetical protein KBZ10_16290 [Streptomyces sp. F63]|uniref:hypothetical protein n=1 Tax=Streptomyces sp. F63 TaxID=2824887 RepID=UPI001B39CD0C|nr:hypothetical protein [Streptomyces sp. F63]MBQ0986049.1 hypothetical protein [Streptomyces sp. F63]